MAKPPKPFSLPDQAKRSLTQLLSKGRHPARKLTRARILLKLDQGQRPLQIARELNVAENTVYNVRNKAETNGWQAALEEQARRGRPQQVSAQARAQITALACSSPPEGHSQWSLRLLADKAALGSASWTRSAMSGSARSSKKPTQAAPEPAVVHWPDHG